MLSWAERGGYADWVLGTGERLVAEWRERPQPEFPFIEEAWPPDELPRLWGVGLRAGEGSPPLLLVDSSDLRRRFGPTMLPELWPDDARAPVFLPIALFPSLGEVVGRWEPPPEAQILAVARPEPISHPGAFARRLNATLVIRSSRTRERGTLCCAIRNVTDSTSGFLTAGHVVPRLGEIVELERRRVLRRASWIPVGRVVCSSDPAETPGIAGWDGAVVEGSAFEWPRYKQVALLPPDLPEPLPAVMHGGISGDVDVQIVGSARVWGGPRRLWTDSWLMVPSGVAVQGDSGSAVQLEDGGLVGLLVGGSREGRTYTVQYVQDLDSMNRVFLGPSGFTVRT